MFEYVNTSVPNGLLPGTHGFCAVAMTRDLPEPVRRRLESFSSYTHLATANGPDYLRLNPVSWSHLVLDGGEHVLGCVRAAPFDYTGRTNRLARFWFFQAAEVPAGLNPADAILQGGNSASLSDAWSGEPRWLAPRPVSPLAGVPPRSDARPAAWIQAFGESDGPRLAAAFSVLLAERIRAKGRPLVFLADPATHSDGSLLLSLFADLIALLPAPLRAKATFSTYPVALSTSTACHLRGEFGDAIRLLAGETAWVDLRARRVHGAETAAVPPELLFLATHGYEQPPEPVIRGGARRPAPLAQPASSPAPSRTPRLARGPKPPVGRLISRTAAPKKKKPGFEDYLLWALLGALVIGVILFIFVFFVPSSPTPIRDEPTPVKTVPKEDMATKDKPKTASKPKAEKQPVTEPTAPTNAPVQQVEQKPEHTVQQAQPKPEETNPLRLAKQIEVVNSFEAKKVKQPEHWVWVYYDAGSNSVSTNRVQNNKFGLNEREAGKRYATLLLNKENGECYWKWYPPTPQQYFSTKNEIDLRRECFGPDIRLFDAWTRCKRKEMYQYRSHADSVKRDCIGPVLTLASVLEASKGELVKLQENLKSVTKEYSSAQKEFDQVEKAYVAHTNAVAKTSQKLDNAQKAYDNLTATPKNQRKPDYKEQKDILKQSLEEVRDKELPNLQKQTTDKKRARDAAETKLDNAKREKSGLEERVAKMKADSEPRVRAAQFTICPPEYRD